MARTSRPARRTEETRRDRVVAAALDLFSRHGVRRTSMSDIAEAVGIAKGSVYLEFRGKQQLLRAVAEVVAREIVDAAGAAAAQDGPLAARVSAILLAKFWRLYDLVHSRPHAAELIGARDQTAADLFRRADDRFADLVTATLTAAAVAGEWRPRESLAPREVAAALLRAAHGTSYGSARLSAAQYRDRVQLAVELILAGAERAR